MPLRATKVRAPMGGWNTRDPVSAMRPDDAVSMTNLIPDIDGVRTRPGYTEHVDIGGGYVNALIQWKTPFGEKFLAANPTSASDHRLYDISTANTSTLLKFGMMSSKWRHASMNTLLGIVNGADQPQRLSFSPGGGIQIQDMPIDGPPNKEKLAIIHIHKSRSYFATGREPAFWYSAVNALGGSLTKFPIDRVAETGGNVVEIKSWTRDGGAGPDDFAVFFLDTGEVLVYKGSNPGDAADWALVGRYKAAGKVLAARQFGGKIHTVTEADYNILPDDFLTEGLGTPSKLSGAARNAVRKDRTDNWTVFFDVNWGWRIINVPAGSKREQHVTNLRTGGSCRFDYPANTWAIYNGELYFGGSGKVFRIREGDDNGSSIEFACQQAFSDFRVAQNKHVRNYRPFFTTNGSLTYSSGLAHDYNAVDFYQSITTSAEGTPWDTSPWDTSPWTTERPAKQDWLIGAGSGQSVSLLINGTTTKKATWHHTDYRIEITDDLL